LKLSSEPAAQEGAQTRLSDAERQRRRRKRGRAIGIVLRDPAAIAALDAGIKIHGGVLAAISAALRMAYPVDGRPAGPEGV